MKLVYPTPSHSRALGWLFSLLLGALPAFAQAQTITGTVFKDFNADGAYTAIPTSGTYAYGEPGLAGVVVTAYGTNSATAPVSATTSALGVYTLTVGATTQFRVEFTNLPAGFYDSFKGTNSSTSVQFVNGGSTGVNLGVNLPENYCQTNPHIVIPCYENGSGATNTNPVLVSLNYTNTGSGANVYPTNVNADRVGSTWGVAYDRKRKFTYVSAFLKRQSGLGDRGLDGIYVVDYNAATPILAGGFDLEGVIPSNGGAPITFGSVTRNLIATGSGTGINDLSADRTLASRDQDAYAKVGKVGYGDIDIDQASNTLWAVNLAERSLIAIDISTTLQGAAIPTTLAAAKVKRYFIDGTTSPAITGIPSCPSGVMRPFALGFRNGVGYLGIVCDGSALTTPDLTAAQQAYVLSFNPLNPTAFTQVTSVPLNYAREQGWVPFTPTTTFDALESDKWQRWIDTYTDPATFGGTVNSANQDVKTGINGLFVAAPQAILADIEFLPNGDLVLGFMDRFAHQQGWANYVYGSATTLRSAVSQGDVLLASFTGSGYVFEGPNENDNFTNPAVAANAQPGQLLNDGPSGAGEFFYHDYYIGSDATHPETALGGLAVLPGSNELTAVSFDPVAFNSMGIRWLNSSTGDQSRTYTIVGNTNITNFGKGSDLGDVEILCDLSPIEIGNRVWKDSNNNGIQDPGEPALPGVVVTLKGPGLPAAGVAVTTNANGEYYFSDASGTNATGFVYSLTGLTAGGSYSLTFPTSASGGAYMLSSKPNSAIGTSADIRDTDPSAAGLVSFTLGSAGQNNFTYDAAYIQPASLGDYVFIDANKDGIQNAGDTPLPGVIVTLVSNGSAVATTLTNASGLYSFTGLDPGTPYSVSFTTPAGYSATAPLASTNTALDSNPVNGITAPVALTAGENNTSIDAGFYLLPASLGDYVFVDTNKDGIQNAGDTPLPGVIVTLYQNGSAVATTTTDASGLYAFTSLAPGTSNSYVVGFTAPTGYSATLTNVGSDMADSDANPITGLTQSVTLAPGEHNPTLDAGFYLPSASLGNFVFEDVNKDGLQDAADLPIPGAVVTLLQSGTVAATTITDASGLYSFTGLSPGLPYSVSFTTPVGFSATTTPNVGTNDAIDSDPVGGITAPMTLSAGEHNPTLDAGFVRPAATPAVTYAIAKTVNLSKVTLGTIVTYTVSLTNTSVTSASNVVVSDAFSTSALTIVGSATASVGMFTPSASGGSWNLPTLVGGQVATLSYQASIDAPGINYNTVTAPDGISASACVTVPYHVCANESFEFLLSVPAGKSSYQWALNGQPIAGATTNTLSATALGEYTVSTLNSTSCPDGSCCPFIVVADPAPSLTALAVSAQCTGTVPQNNAAITLVGSSMGAVSYNITKASSFTAATPLFGSPQALSALVGGVLLDNQLNPAVAQDYTIRVYAASGCFADTVVTLLPANCACPPPVCAPFVVRKTKSQGKPVAP